MPYIWHDEIDAKSFYQNWDDIKLGLEQREGGALVLLTLESLWDWFMDKISDVDYDVSINFSDSGNLCK